jgi:hypothetical protein
MNNELKKAIIEKIFENKNQFNLTNYIIDNFRNYIYNQDGDYLIGGEIVSNFISDAIDLIIE